MSLVTSADSGHARPPQQPTMMHEDLPGEDSEEDGELLEQSLSLPAPLHEPNGSGGDSGDGGGDGYRVPLRSLVEPTLEDIQREYPHLTELNLENNELRFSSISPHLALYLPALRSLNLSFNQLSRIPELGALTQLQSLQLKGNSISHIEHLSRCSRLEQLDLAQNSVSDLPALCSELYTECPSLTSLQLQHNPLSSQQYRVALISLLPSLHALDGLTIRAEEKAYLQLLAATHVESREGEQSEQEQTPTHQQPQQNQPLTIAAGVAPVLAYSRAVSDDMRVQGFNDEVESPRIPSGRSSRSSTPRTRSVSPPPPGTQRDPAHAEAAALANAAAAAVQQRHERQERKQHEAEEASARQRSTRIPAVEPQHPQPEAFHFHAAAAPAAVSHSNSSRSHLVSASRPFSMIDSDRPLVDPSSAPASVDQSPPSLQPTPAASRSVSQIVSRSASPLQSKSLLLPPPPPQPDPFGLEYSSQAPLPPASAASRYPAAFQPPPPAADYARPAPPASAPPQPSQPFAQHWPVDPSFSYQQPPQSYAIHPQYGAAPLPPQQLQLQQPYQPQQFQQPLYQQPLQPQPSPLLQQPHQQLPQMYFVASPPAAVLPAAPVPAVAAPVVVAPTPTPAPATSAAMVNALSEQTQLVQNLHKELQEVKESLAREQAHVRTVKAYYYQPEEKSSSHAAASHTRQPSAASPAVAVAPSSFTSPFLLPPLLSASSHADAAAAAASANSSGMLDSYRSEIAHLKKQNELLQIQNDTTQEILRMKDRQSEEQRAKPGRGAASQEPDLSILWRDKVFALLVQNKSLLLTHAADLKGHKQQVLDKSQIITRLEQQVLLLTKSNESLQTQLQIVHNDSAHRQQLQQQAHLMQTHAQAAQQRTTRDVASIRYLLGVFEQQVGQMEKNSQARLDSKLDQFNRRLSFAQQRIQVVRAMKTRKGGAAAAGASDMTTPTNGPIPLIPLPESKEVEDEEDQTGDETSQHLRKEIKRLQADRSLIYSSWQREVSSLRADLYAQSSSLSSSASSLKSLQDSLLQSQTECQFLAAQNAELRKESQRKVPEEFVAEIRREHARQIEALEAELSSVRTALGELKTKHDLAHRTHLKTQLELQQARHALAQAKTEASEMSQAKYEYLEEKLRRRETQHEEMVEQRRAMQQQIRDMDHQIILLKHGVGQPPQQQQPTQHPSYSSSSQQATQQPQQPFVMPNGSSLAPSAANASSRPTISATSISNLLFGSGGPTASYTPAVAAAASSSSYAPHVPFARPPPLQPSQWPPTTSSFPASVPIATSSLLHDHPIPAVFGQSAAAMEQQLSASTSAAPSRQESRSTSVAPSPMRTRPTMEGARLHAAPHIPTLQLPSTTVSSMRPTLNVRSPPLASSAAPSGLSQSRPTSSSDVSRKLSHLAALSARLLDDDD